MYDPLTAMEFKPGGGQADADKTMIVEFFTEAQQNQFRSAEEGRPVFDDVEKVRIIIPGSRLSGDGVIERVKEDHRRRWPQQYAAFKAGREAPVDGTPITEWPPLSPAQARNLAALNVRTVEALAAVTDAALGDLGMGARELREKARTWLLHLVDGKPLAKATSEVAELRAQLAAKDETIASLTEAVAKLQAKTPSVELTDDRI